ncbi:hypothetical protein [Catenuloplanes atrovinosus]|uniref:Uncharacterized protein n=1 Tax=Catenuloplanes atrovinosus TaxID=137266 RepID=A0AAE3YS79_9ACTN|nr:hypothetical protein [Catenuloplanes atrovinosus]MDR7279008.1 hypothetical protein [Catenuloplanes atrovinosus]
MPDAPTTGWLPMFTETTDLPDQRRAPVTGPAFRMPAETDPAPTTRRLLAMCAWSGALALLGLTVAVRSVAAMFAGTAPHWLDSALLGAGVTGIALTVGAFTSIHRRRLPWAMLALATAALIAAAITTVLTA